MALSRMQARSDLHRAADSGPEQPQSWGLVIDVRPSYLSSDGNTQAGGGRRGLLHGRATGFSVVLVAFGFGRASAQNIRQSSYHTHVP